MPKRNAEVVEERTSPVRRKKSSDSPSETKVAKIDKSVAEGSKALPVSPEKTDGRKRKRSVVDDTVDIEKKKIDVKEDSVEFNVEPEDDSEEAKPKVKVRSILVNREDPVGLVAIRDKVLVSRRWFEPLSAFHLLITVTNYKVSNIHYTARRRKYFCIRGFGCRMSSGFEFLFIFFSRNCSIIFQKMKSQGQSS